MIPRTHNVQLLLEDDGTAGLTRLFVVDLRCDGGSVDIILMM